MYIQFFHYYKSVIQYYISKLCKNIILRIKQMETIPMHIIPCYSAKWHRSTSLSTYTHEIPNMKPEFFIYFASHISQEKNKLETQTSDSME